MGDLLDRVAAPGLDLLRRVDAALVTGGAPAGDPVWALLRRAGALPSDILEHLIGSDGPALLPIADDLDGLRRALRAEVDAIPGAAGWSGYAADEYAAQWSAAVSQVDRIVERLSANADYGAAVAGWVATTRRQVAGAVAECLASREAATVRLGQPGSPEVSVAAAAVAARVLTAALDAADAGYALCDAWSGRLDEVAYAPPAPVTSGGPNRIEV